MQAAIEARAVGHRTRAGKVAIRDITLTLGQGELMAIIGGRGSGKTTLLDAMSGRCPPTSGTVVRHPAGETGYVAMGDTLHPVLPLARALRYTVALRGVTASPEAVRYTLGMVGLAADAAAPVGTLDPGERKRAAIAAELLAGRRVLFLDEPTAGVDPAQATETLRLLRRLARGGMTVLLTTSSPLDADRCDKVAVLAAGGHLAFFGTPAAARGYFGADSLEEIYERLSGLGDPAAAWSRRFFQFPQAQAAFAPVPAMPRAPGRAVLVPDAAGPHSAGRPALAIASGTADLDLDPDLDPDLDLSESGVGEAGLGRHGFGEPGPGEHSAVAYPAGARSPAALAGGDAQAPPPPGRGSSRPRPLRQLRVLIRRDAEVLARARRALVTLVAAPVAVLLFFCVLLGVGALDGPFAVTLAWAVLGGLATALAYQLPLGRIDCGVLRGETFSGMSGALFAVAKAAVLLPALAVADLLTLAVPAADGRLHAGFAAAYLAVLAACAVGLAAALTVPVVSARR